MDSKNKKVTRVPGELVHTRNREIEESTLSIICYDKEFLEVKEETSLEDVLEDLENEAYQKPSFWLNVYGLQDIALIDKIGKKLGVHALSLEDVFNVRHRPKIDFYKDYTFISLKMIDIPNPDDLESIRYEQISFFIFPQGQNLLTIQEYKGDLFNLVRKNIKEEIGKVRASKVDYLLYRLIDIIVDHYSFVTEVLMNRIEELETEIGDEANQAIVNEVQQLRSKIVRLKKSVFPVKEVLFQITKEDNNFLSPKIEPHFNDVNDHIVSIIDNINNQKEALANLMVIYQTNVSFKMNQVMSVLTVLSVIFIPLTFICGLYGMNFKYMPELDWEYGYLYFWGLILLVLGLNLYIFKKKKWL